MSYFLHLCIMASIYVLLVQSLNIVLGFSGRLLLAQFAFFGVGAYGAGLVLIATDGALVPSLATAILIGAGAGWVCAVLTARLADELFVLATLGVHVITHSVLNNWVSMTGGPYGLSGIPEPSILSLRVSDKLAFASIAFALAAGGCLLLWAVGRLPFSRCLLALRDDELAFRMLGKSPTKFISTSLVVCGAATGAAGGLYASYVGYLDPTIFTVTAALLVVTAVVVGGGGAFVGGLVGTALIVLLPELLRLLPVASGRLVPIRDLIFGLLIIVFLRVRPQGILGRYSLE